ncbi:MAG: DUF1501 domain-containing protein [Planctomycetota bacterium]|nr:DUF1501 domain-containing protein [Planctomycetota bacterium]
MLSIYQTLNRTKSQFSRRQVLTAGGAGLFGLSLPKVLEAESDNSHFRKGRAKSVIFLFLFGGPSQLETFDLKPEASAEIRGPFRPTSCRTPGLIMSDQLPKLAQSSDQFCIVRSMSHSFNDHSGAGHYLQTGRRWHIPVGGGFSATPEDWPSYGSVVEYLSQKQPGGINAEIPGYAVLPNRLGKLQEGGKYVRPGEYAGWLGKPYNPLTTFIGKKSSTDNPYWRNCSDEELRFDLEGLGTEVSLDVMRQRISLAKQFDQARKARDQSFLDSGNPFRDRAVAMVTSDRTRKALDIRKESPKTRDTYGRHLFGQSCLVARKLVEAGVRFVTVHYDCVDGYSWDSHRNSDDVKKHLLPTFDQGCSALLGDLKQRGLLDDTMVIAIGEMGRTPKANPAWGRDHWSTLFSALIAGGGVNAGSVYGKSDPIAAYATENPTSPEDLAATIYWRMGIDPGLMLPDALGRPTPMISGGNPLKAIFT